MAVLKSVFLPKWLDEIIYDDFEAVYEPRPQEVEYNPDQQFEFVKLYLGTYFPRSYSEAYCIMSRMFDNPAYKLVMSQFEEINILDFCCGTGGEIFGLIHSLNDNLPNLKRVNVDAFDANPDAIRFLYHLMEKINNAPDITLEVNIVPQGFYVETELDLVDFVSLPNFLYHFIVSFKALNEFVQSNTFPNKNVYELVSSYLLPLLDEKGILILSDVTTSLKGEKGVFYPTVMNNGINASLARFKSYKTAIPHPCYHYEDKCQGCYMQESFYVTHSRRSHDLSKVAYRVIGRSNFVDYIMNNNQCSSCRFLDINADKSLPYNN